VTVEKTFAVKSRKKNLVAGPGIMLEKYPGNFISIFFFPQSFTFFKNTCYGPNLSPIYSGPLGRLEMTEIYYLSQFF